MMSLTLLTKQHSTPVTSKQGKRKAKQTVTCTMWFLVVNWQGNEWIVNLCTVVLWHRDTFLQKDCVQTDGDFAQVLKDDICKEAPRTFLGSHPSRIVQ